MILPVSASNTVQSCKNFSKKQVFKNTEITPSQKQNNKCNSENSISTGIGVLIFLVLCDLLYDIYDNKFAKIDLKNEAKKIGTEIASTIKKF